MTQTERDTMTPTEQLLALQEQVDELLDEIRPAEFPDVDETLKCWAIVDEIITDLSVLRSEMSNIAAKIIPIGYTTEDGELEVHTVTPTNTKWDGHGILNALGVPLIDQNSGEVIRAVPVDVLQDVLPACGKGATSSKWKITKLKDHIVIDPYLTTDYKAASVKYGERPKYG
jgi:hypothetical protein